MNVQALNHRQRLTRCLGHAVLVALLLFQVGYASHLDEHAIGDTVESCEYCLQLDNQDDSIAPGPAPFALTPRKDALPAAGLYRIGHQYLPTCRARAPPSV